MNRGLKKFQENKKLEYKKKVLKAVEFIKKHEGENAILSAEKIIKLSKVSKTLLYKEHIRPLWDRNWQAEQSEGGKEQQKLVQKELAALQAENEKLQKHLKNAEQKIEQMEKKLANKQNYCDGLEERLDEYRETNKKLRGEITTLQNQLKARGLT